MELVYVDGYKIRQTLDVEFTMIHLQNEDASFYDSKWYIPKWEIWFDHAFKGEEDFLARILLSIKTRREAEAFRNAGALPTFVIKEERKDGLAVQYVDGKVVREYLDPEFVFGGHDLVYSYVPAETIWIDNRQDPRDIPHTLLHELTERKLMAETGKSYDIAHDYAMAAEKDSRRTAGGAYIGDAHREGGLVIEEYYIERYCLPDWAILPRRRLATVRHHQH
jgi:hypothetical protein